ncbi:MAG: discoidin domain-containing protein [Phycisphaerales bacterium]|nr:MAG: discoidin domain-containing protein [Phycisphaerales bacterium]
MTRLTIICISAIIASLMFAGQGYADIDPDTILGIWLLDEGSGDTTKDSSGNGHNGTLGGGPKWINGVYGKALDFSGSSSYVDCGNAAELNVEVFSVAFWCYIPSTQSWNHMVSRGEHHGGGNPGAVNWGVMMYDAQQTILYEAFNDTVKPSISASTTTGEWHHVVATHDGATMQLYHDGQLAGTSSTTGILLDGNLPFIIGAQSRASGPSDYFSGSIDEVGYFSAVLSPEDIKTIMDNGLAEIIGVLPVAADPQPADGETDAQRDLVLGWTPGEFANTHDVYLGTTFGDVNDASRTDPLNVLARQDQSDSTHDPGRLEFETTYYWRVDEVNAPPDNTIFKGDIWSFITEPVGYPIDSANIAATASSTGQADFGPENTINGSGLDADDLHSTGATDMWLSGNEPLGAWIQYEFDNVYKLHEMWVWNSNQVLEAFFGFGMKDVTVEYSTNGTEWTALGGVPEFAQASGAAGYAHNTSVDFGGAVAKYVRLTTTSNWGGVLPQYGLSEVRFFSIPVSVREPSPDSGAIDADLDATLAWRAGREAATHRVYLSTDEQAVMDGTAPAVSVTDASYSSVLDLGSTYFWRIDEVNDAETPTTWQGDVWSFSTPEYLVVDGFEDYNDYPPDEIYSTWLDGYENPANGSQVGNLTPPLVETTTVRGGVQSMPLFYSNTGGAAYSEAERTFISPQDWTKHGIQTLVLYFHGTPGNTGQLYVKVNGVKVPYDGDAAAIAKIRWQQWNIDLASLGVNLASVTTLALGIDGNGAAGTLYVDDIVLYRLAPEVVVPSEELWIEAEAAVTITDPMKTYDDPVASGGKYIGTDDGIGDEYDNPPATGVATYNFAVAGGTYKISIRVQIPGASNSFWFRIQGATTPAETELHSSGWVRWNDPPDLGGWFWSDVFSDDDNEDATVLFTMDPGTYTLEIARREDGAQLDLIVISKID